MGVRAWRAVAGLLVAMGCAGCGTADPPSLGGSDGLDRFGGHGAVHPGSRGLSLLPGRADGSVRRVGRTNRQRGHVLDGLRDLQRANLGPMRGRHPHDQERRRARPRRRGPSRALARLVRSRRRDVRRVRSVLQRFRRHAFGARRGLRSHPGRRRGSGDDRPRADRHRRRRGRRNLHGTAVQHRHVPVEQPDAGHRQGLRPERRTTATPQACPSTTPWSGYRTPWPGRRCRPSRPASRATPATRSSKTRSSPRR